MKDKPKILCICTMGLNRSKWTAEYLAKKGYQTRYGGVGPCKWDPKPGNPVDPKDIEWADIIITARDKHKPILKEKYGVKNKKIISLEVTDSKRKISEKFPEFKNMEQAEFNKRWTHPQLEKEIGKYLPFEN
jgi:predicted protein tyrosine phosphatase